MSRDKELDYFYLLTTYGSFSRPFLNWLLSGQIALAWRHYFLALRFLWQKRSLRALKEINLGIKKCRRNRTLYYLLLAEKMNLLDFLKDVEGKALYRKLRLEQKRVPWKARRILMSSLVNYRALDEPSRELPRTRSWGKGYAVEESGLIFLHLAKARSLIREGSTKDALALYRSSIDLAKSIPHPTGLIDALNELAWYGRQTDLGHALQIAREAAYFVGYYFEAGSRWTAVFDTLFEVQKSAHDPAIIETAAIFRQLIELAPQAARQSLEERYQRRLEQCPRLQFDLNSSTYLNTPELRESIKVAIPSYSAAQRLCGVARSKLSDFCRGKVQTIRGSTLRKLLQGLAWQPEPCTAPSPLLTEWKRIQLKDRFKRALKAAGTEEQNSLILRLFSTYMAYFDRRRSFPSVARKGQLKKLYFRLKGFEKWSEGKESWDAVKLVGDAFDSIHPFLQARRDLAYRFLSRFSQKQLYLFISGYLELSEEKKVIMDSFIRNYERYCNFPDLNIQLPKGLSPLVKMFTLNPEAAVIAYHALDSWHQQKAMLEIISPFFVSKRLCSES